MNQAKDHGLNEQNFGVHKIAPHYAKDSNLWDSITVFLLRVAQSNGD